MVDMPTIRTLSTFVQAPTKVIAELDTGDVLLTRRGGESLLLSKAIKSDSQARTLAALTQLIAASLDDETTDRMVGHLSGPFAWLELLPDDRRREFVGAFLRLARACASVGTFERLTIFLEAWQATAAAYADPSVTVDGSDLTYLADVEAVPHPRSG